MTRIGRSVRVADGSEVAAARRTAIQCAEELRLSGTTTGKAALLATEMATNLIKHGDGGTLVFGSEEQGGQALTIIAIDKGRGIANVNAALRDGFSTAGSQGTGLGAIQRSASFFDVYSVSGHGTAVLCRLADEVNRIAPVPVANRVTVGGICIPKPPETESGDAWESILARDVVTISVVDGLGHGPAAALASSSALRVFREQDAQPLDRMFADAHAALRPTRGAAVGIARLHTSAGRLDFIGVGNIAGTIVADEGVRRVVSSNGIVGHEMRKVQVFSYPWTASSVLILQSDGVSANWNPAAYPGLMQHDPALIAAVLYRDHCRGTDDATVVVAKAS
jgi:anti-sigma regulatory factor (Ser/Thr protein kinase)